MVAPACEEGGVVGEGAVGAVVAGGAEGFFIEVERQGLHPSRDMPQIVEIAARYGIEFVGPPPA